MDCHHLLCVPSLTMHLMDTPPLINCDHYCFIVSLSLLHYKNNSKGWACCLYSITVNIFKTLMSWKQQKWSGLIVFLLQYLEQLWRSPDFFSCYRITLPWGSSIQLCPLDCFTYIARGVRMMTTGGTWPLQSHEVRCVFSIHLQQHHRFSYLPYYQF